MLPSEPRYLITASPEFSNTAEPQENNFETNFMKMVEVINKEMNKSLNGIQEYT